MIKVTLPDGSERDYADGASPLDVAESISKSLAKKALAAKVDGEMWDLVRPLEGDATVAIITDRDPEGLELIRHDAAHVLWTCHNGRRTWSGRVGGRVRCPKGASHLVQPSCTNRSRNELIRYNGLVA